MRLIAGIIANAIAILATTVVPGSPGITFNGGWLTLLVAGAIFGLFNAIVRPIAFFLSLPFLVLTLGFFYFVLNGILLKVASLLMPGYQVKGLWAAILGGLVVGVVNWALHALFGLDKK